LLASAATGLIAGCAEPLRHLARLPPTPRRTPGAKPIIDVHCHVFNGSDLAISGYVNGLTTERIGSGALRVPLSYVLDLVEQFYAGASLGTDAEFRLLLMTRPGRPLHDTFYLQKRHGQSLGDFYENVTLNLNWRSPGRPDPGGPLRPTRVEPDTRNDAQEATFRFLGYVLKPRATLALILDEISRREENAPVLLTPALVDMRNWVDGNDTRLGQFRTWLNRQTFVRLAGMVEGLTGVAIRTTTISEQMRVMRLLAERRPDNLLVHPFVPYDPWRGAVDLASGRADEALRNVREAILAHGAVGVKLYPPMGFRASRNEELPNGEFRTEIRDAIGAACPDRPRVGYWLDRALAGLYGWCDRTSVPLMAHTGPSHAGNGYARYRCRADPSFWWDVLRTHKKLRVNLGHFGGIWNWRETSEEPDPDCATELAWPDRAYDLIETPEFHGRVYADMADVPMGFVRGGDGLDAPTRTLVARFKRQFGAATPVKAALMYGSDFPFTVLEGVAVDYRSNFERTLGKMPDGFGFSDTEVEDIMWRNAARFLGLTRDERTGALGRTAERLIEFHSQVIQAEDALTAHPARVEAVALDLIGPFLAPPMPEASRPVNPAHGRSRPRSVPGGRSAEGTAR
jgi:predicted TIM-barrel fold metal-dependent hydrolase